MQLPALYQGRLIRRYKRFLADIETRSGPMTIHCPNTGAMTGCAAPGSLVWYSLSDNPKRKYPATWEFVDTGEGICSVNTTRANLLVGEALRTRTIDLFEQDQEIQAEARIPGGGGRFDFRVGESYVEVKSVTLRLADGSGAFPDAVSERARKHVRALQAVVRGGHRGVLIFCVQHTGIESVRPAWEIDPDYAAELEAAISSGVEVYAFAMDTDLTTSEIVGQLPVRLNSVSLNSDV